jgi:hypothetical protein
VGRGGLAFFQIAVFSHETPFLCREGKEWRSACQKIGDVIGGTTGKKAGYLGDETIRETLQPIFQPQTLNALKFASIIGHQDQSFAARMPGDM